MAILWYWAKVQFIRIFEHKNVYSDQSPSNPVTTLWQWSIHSAQPFCLFLMLSQHWYVFLKTETRTTNSCWCGYTIDLYSSIMVFSVLSLFPNDFWEVLCFLNHCIALIWHFHRAVPINVIPNTWSGNISFFSLSAQLWVLYSFCHYLAKALCNSAQSVLFFNTPKSFVSSPDVITTLFVDIPDHSKSLESLSNCISWTSLTPYTHQLFLINLIIGEA